MLRRRLVLVFCFMVLVSCPAIAENGTVISRSEYSTLNEKIAESEYALRFSEEQLIRYVKYLEAGLYSVPDTYENGWPSLEYPLYDGRGQAYLMGHSLKEFRRIWLLC